MSQFNETTLILDKKFDPKICRHYLNGQVSVLHCHHYSTLYTQLAVDAGETDLLADVAEDTFYNLLTSYYKSHNIDNIEDRIDIAIQYYATVGLGKMQVNFLGDESGEVELLVSHLDKGWIKKWGNYDKPVNFITVGYIKGMFSAVFCKPTKTFKASEIKSIVMGDNSSIFKVFKA